MNHTGSDTYHSSTHSRIRAPAPSQDSAAGAPGNEAVSSYRFPREVAINLICDQLILREVAASIIPRLNRLNVTRHYSSLSSSQKCKPVRRRTEMLTGRKVSSPGDVPLLRAGHHKDRHPWSSSVPMGHPGTGQLGDQEPAKV